MDVYQIPLIKREKGRQECFDSLRPFTWKIVMKLLFIFSSS